MGLDAQMESGARMSPDVAPQDDLAVADLMGDFSPIETRTAVEALTYLPSVRNEASGRAHSVATDGGRVALVEVDLDGFSVEDALGELGATVEALAAWRTPTESQARYLDTYVRGTARYGTARYVRLFGLDDAQRSSVNPSGEGRQFVLVCGRIRAKGGVEAPCWLDYHVTDEGRWELVRWGTTPTHSPSALKAQAQEVSRVTKMVAIAAEPSIDGRTGYLLVEYGDSTEGRSVAEATREVDLTEGVEILRKLAKFQQDRWAEDLVLDVDDPVMEAPPLD